MKSSIKVDLERYAPVFSVKAFYGSDDLRDKVLCQMIDPHHGELTSPFFYSISNGVSNGVGDHYGDFTIYPAKDLYSLITVIQNWIENHQEFQRKESQSSDSVFNEKDDRDPMIKVPLSVLKDAVGFIKMFKGSTDIENYIPLP